MRAQVQNDAAGWNTYEYLPYAESEPVDPALVKGNYTHTELPATQGYKLTVPVGMANDYNGYIATYREYQRGDHYRKALTAWGPHSSDYMSTHLMEMGGFLNGGPPVPDDPGQEKVEPDLALNDQKAVAIGTVGRQAIQEYEAQLPDDGGDPRQLEPPKDVERFGATLFKWVGGSNYTDGPRVRVERRAGKRWRVFADGQGEVPVTLKFPDGPGVQSYLSGDHEWTWTAHFEAFAAPFDPGMGTRATPVGTYRFVVFGAHRDGGKRVRYVLRSTPFRVRPWSGITVEDLRVSKRGVVSFRVGPRKTIEVKGNKEADPASARPEGRDRADRLPRHVQVPGALHRRRADGAARPARPERRLEAGVVLLPLHVAAVARRGRRAAGDVRGDGRARAARVRRPAWRPLAHARPACAAARRPSCRPAACATGSATSTAPRRRPSRAAPAAADPDPRALDHTIWCSTAR